MKNNAEEKVSKFYNSIGWKIDGEITEDAKRWEDLRECAEEYVRNCRLRVLKYIPSSGDNLLDMASGPIQYKEYLEYSKNYKRRYCVDLSSSALEIAKERIGGHGVFLNGSFFDIPLENNFFDCAVSLHTIYHMDKNKQEEAVRKLINVTKPGKPVIIVYSNPKALTTTLKTFTLSIIESIKSIFYICKTNPQDKDVGFYFYAHPNIWWNKFSDVASVKIVPWRSFSAGIQKRLVPNNKLGKLILKCIFNLEESFPNLFSKYFQYPMIVLIKK